MSKISTRDISDSLFNHIENKNKYPIEKVIIFMKQYLTQQQEIEEHKNDLRMEYVNQYESPRSVQNAKYKQYLEERQELKKELNYENIKKLAKLQFHYDDIPDVYTITIYDHMFKKPPPQLVNVTNVEEYSSQGGSDMDDVNRLDNMSDNNSSKDLYEVDNMSDMSDMSDNDSKQIEIDDNLLEGGSDNEEYNDEYYDGDSDMNDSDIEDAYNDNDIELN